MTSNNKKNNQLSPALLRLTIIAGVILIASSLGVFIFVFQPDWFKQKTVAVNTDNDLAVATQTPENICVDCVRRNIDGVLVAPTEAQLKPYAVMIDNHFAARPQFGLSSASLVYEIPVEGGITRYLAFFTPDQIPDKVGPVRSARDYFVDIAKELGATYVHCGGSPDALTAVKSLGKSNLDEFYNAAYFWREQDRLAPHNVLTSAEKLANYRLDNSEKNTAFDSWPFKDAKATSTQVAGQIKIKYPQEFAVFWQFNPQTNEYERFLNDKSHYDAQGNKIIAKNIAVQLVNLSVIDDKLRLKLEQGLNGKALLCQDGICELGSYKKSVGKRAVYYAKNGAEFTWNAGPTWIEMIDDWNLLEY